MVSIVIAPSVYTCYENYISSSKICNCLHFDTKLKHTLNLKKKLCEMMAVVELVLIHVVPQTIVTQNNMIMILPANICWVSWPGKYVRGVEFTAAHLVHQID